MLSLYFSGFEIALLKRCLRSIAGPEKRPVKLELFQDFYQLQNNQPMSQDQEALVRRCIQTIWEGTP